MNYKEEIYKNYVSNHNVHLYGPVTLERLKIKHKLWDYLYDKHLPENKNSDILDIGCGEGAFISYLMNKGYSNLEGIDISEEQIALGKKLGIKNIQEADIFSYLGKFKNKYDFVIARDLLEHFTKAEIFEILRLTYDVLKEKGKMMVQVPNGEGIWHEKIFYGDFTHETLFSKESARQVFTSVGFSTVQSYPLEFPGSGLKSAIRKMIWKCISGFERFRRWIATGDPSGIITPNLLVLAEK
jgi:2-polyprenyl-3-methyl-5-hydroxy-6-metoxy-1,4-benzoquinol methylase